VVVNLEAVIGWRMECYDSIQWLVNIKPLECDKVTLPSEL
jgi:hypothetical protein